MSLINSTHDLLDIPDAKPAPAARDGRSRYCYLFRELADEGSAGSNVKRPSGCFSDIDESSAEETTVKRLKTFIDCFERMESGGKALMMELPAAYTYFGQFVNHDISAPVGGIFANISSFPPAGIIGTADPIGVGKEVRGDTQAILDHFVNEHPVPLSLASLYGDGPDSDDPDVAKLYRCDGEGDGKRFLVAKTYDAATDPIDVQTFVNAKIDPKKVNYRRDAPDIRRRDYLPLIADRRNDGNLILSQLHLAFLLFHNKAVAALEQKYPIPADCFGQARKLVTQHYHWLILNDYLPKLMSQDVLREGGLDRWKPKLTQPNEVPMEFTTAAFRFGHSMVSHAYDFNENFGVGGVVAGSALLAELFLFTSKANMGRPNDPSMQLPHHWVIDWDRMTRPFAAGQAGSFSRAEQIDVNFPWDMLNQAGQSNAHAEHGSIMFRNLMRGFHRRIPFGQKLAEQYNVPRLNPDDILEAITDKSNRGQIEAFGIHKETPAWLYFLLESQLLQQGERIGPTASHIIGDTIIGLMFQNDHSILKQKGGSWHPRNSLLKGDQPEGLTSIRDFLMFATK